MKKIIIGIAAISAIVGATIAVRKIKESIEEAG
jgi:hypothetical protein